MSCLLSDKCLVSQLEFVDTNDLHAAILDELGGKAWKHVCFWLHKHRESAWITRFQLANHCPDALTFLSTSEDDLRGLPRATEVERQSLLRKIRKQSLRLQFHPVKKALVKFYHGGVPEKDRQRTLAYIARKSCDKFTCSELKGILFTNLYSYSEPHVFGHILAVIGYCMEHCGGIGMVRKFLSPPTLYNLSEWTKWPIERREDDTACFDQWVEHRREFERMKGYLSAWKQFEQVEPIIKQSLDGIKVQERVTAANLCELLRENGIEIHQPNLEAMVRSVSTSRSDTCTIFQVLTLAWHHRWHLKWQTASRSRSSAQSMQNNSARSGISKSSVSSSSSASSSSRTSVVPPSAVGERPPPPTANIKWRSNASPSSSSASRSSSSRISDPSRRRVELLRTELGHDSKLSKSLEFVDDADLLMLPEESINALCDGLNKAGGILGAPLLKAAWQRHHSSGDKRPRSAVEGELEACTSASSRTLKKQKTAHDPPTDSKADAMADALSPKEMPTDSKAGAMADAADGLSPEERPSPATRSSASLRDGGRAHTSRSDRTPQVRPPLSARHALRGSEGSATPGGHKDDMHDVEEVGMDDVEEVAAGGKKVTTGDKTITTGNKRVAVGNMKVAMVDDEAEMGDGQAGMDEDEANFNEEEAGEGTVVEVETSNVESQYKVDPPRITRMLTPKGVVVVTHWPQDATPEESALGENKQQEDPDVDMDGGDEEIPDSVEIPRPKPLEPLKCRSTRSVPSPEKSSKGVSGLLASSKKNSGH